MATASTNLWHKKVFFFLQIQILRATTVLRRELLKLLQTEEFYALRKQVMAVMWNVEIIAGFASKESLVIGSLRFMLGSVLLSSLISSRRRSGSNVDILRAFDMIRIFRVVFELENTFYNSIQHCYYE